MNWSEFKDPVSNMCLVGIVVACWSLTQVVAGSSPFIVMRNIFVTEIAEFSETFRENFIAIDRQIYPVFLIDWNSQKHKLSVKFFKLCFIHSNVTSFSIYKQLYLRFKHLYMVFDTCKRFSGLAGVTVPFFGCRFRCLQHSNMVLSMTL